MKKKKVIVSPIAQTQFLAIRQYLTEKWSDKVRSDFEKKTEEKIGQIVEFPKSCPESTKKKGVYKAVIEDHNSFYYRIKKNQIELLIFVDNRMNPKHNKEQLKRYGK